MRSTMTDRLGRRAFVVELARGAALGTLLLDRPASLFPRRISRAERDRREQMLKPPYHMVVLGDSIAWGQGLRDDEKFSTLVQNWLASRLPDRKVVKWTFAHSGAVLGPDDHDNRAPLPSEVPVRYPSVLAQLTRSRSYLANPPITDFDHAGPVRPEEVSLVLVDGGINDVDVHNVLTCDPTIERPEDWIRGLARHRCVERMRDDVLPRLLRTFSNAQVIVTGYYAIVSNESRLGDLEKLLDHLGLLGSLGSLGVTELVRQKLAAQSAAFADETATGLAAVVPAVQPLQVIASASTASTATPPSVPGAATLQAQLRQAQPGRAHFVDCRFTPDDAFGAPQAKLWGLPAADPMAQERQRQCASLGAQVEYMTCLEASAGHPNVNGARLYANRIIARLDCILARESRATVLAGGAAHLVDVGCLTKR